MAESDFRFLDDIFVHVDRNLKKKRRSNQSVVVVAVVVVVVVVVGSQLIGGRLKRPSN